VYKVSTRLVFNSVDEGLAEEEADVMEGGCSDGEALLTVPHNVPLVWTQAPGGKLCGRHGEDNTLHIFYSTIMLSIETMTHNDAYLIYFETTESWLKEKKKGQYVH